VNEEKIKDLIIGWSWTFAKTMPQIPHWYVVRSPENEEAFIEFVEFIRVHGVEERFGQSTYLYLYIGEYKYWTMGNPVPETTIINRALAKRPTEEETTSQNALGEAKGVGLRIKVKS